MCLAHGRSGVHTLLLLYRYHRYYTISLATITQYRYHHLTITRLLLLLRYRYDRYLLRYAYDYYYEIVTITTTMR